ncbi:hypothetical protein KR222_011385 [Zaprionus bogoriensis]|nr:hypothetical protein KR222_011385 [Zaprionus bogoriensis]
MFNLRLLRQLRHGLIRPTIPTVPVTVSPRRLLAGQHKRRPQLGAAQTEQLDQLKSEYFERRSELDDSEWQRVRATLTDEHKYITGKNVDAVILGMCSSAEKLPLAKSYMRFLQAQGATPNAATLGRLLRVYHAAYQTRPLTEKEQAEVLQICDVLQGAHELLDASSCEYLIHGLVATTQHWQRAVPLLEMMKLTSTPTTAAYSALASKAFSAQQPELAWRLLEEMLQARKLPKCEVYLAHLASSAAQPQTLRAQLERLLLFLERHDILISATVAEQLLLLAQRLPKQLKASSTRLDATGKCGVCQQHLQRVAISDAQFAELRESFLQKVLIRHDVFQKSTPEEVKRFKRHVQQTAPYDCVIDGLNVAYSMGAKKPPQQLARLLATVVRHFKERRKSVLVLGRQHMRQWSKPAWQYIQQNASVFLTNNLSQDDPFLLYATLQSGQDTDFFSRDLMRSHAFLLGAELKPIFRRWQQEHQYSLLTQTQTGQIVVKEPIRHRLSAHRLQEGTWHVPYCESYTPQPPEGFELPPHWLCLTLVD